MNKTQIYKLESETGAKAIESEAEGLVYFVYPGDKRIAIGAKHVAILTKEQALAIAKELPDILDLYCGGNK